MTKAIKVNRIGKLEKRGKIRINQTGLTDLGGNPQLPQGLFCRCRKRPRLVARRTGNQYTNSLQDNNLQAICNIITAQKLYF